MNDSFAGVPTTPFYGAVLHLLAGELQEWTLEEVLTKTESVRLRLRMSPSDLQAAIIGESDVVVVVRGVILTRDHFMLEWENRRDPHDLVDGPADSNGQSDDTGAHYRYAYHAKITDEDVARGFVQVNLDPYRIADIYNLGGGPREHIVKKGLRGTGKGSSERQLIKELRDALNRWEQMLIEDES